VLVALLLALYLAVQYTPFQNYIVKKTAAYLTNQLGTKVAVEHIDFTLLNRVNINGVFVADKANDTLAYIGTAQVKITDWFFLKDSSTIHYAGLKNTVINLTRHDSVWNYQHIVDYFGSGSSSSGKKKKGLQLDLKAVDIENLTLNTTDGWVGQNQTIAVKNVHVAANKIDFNSNQFNIEKITLNQPLFKTFDYEGLRDSLHIPRKPKKPTDPTLKFRWNNSGLALQVAEVQITNGAFVNFKTTNQKNTTNLFDGRHIAFEGITGTGKNVTFIGDTLRANVDLKTKESCGFEVTQLKAAFKFTPVIMEFKNLNLQTPYSRVYDYYAMQYDTFNNDMAKFITNVNLVANFKNGSNIHTTDIAFFAPKLSTWQKNLAISGSVTGSVNNLNAKNIKVATSQTTIAGNLAMRGLPDINTTFIDYTGTQLQTTYNDLLLVVPTLKKVTQPQLNKLTNLSYVGNFKGFVNNFAFNGLLNTNLGAIKATVAMQLPAQSPAQYKGSLQAVNFNLGSLINQKNIDNISVTANIAGKGFALNNANVTANGTLTSLNANNYNYKNISFNSALKNNNFTSLINSTDPNLTVNNLNVGVNMASKNLIYSLNGQIEKLNLKNLNLTKEDYQGYGKVNVNFSGTSLDNFLGTANITDAELLHEGKKLNFSRLGVSTTLVNGQKRLSVTTNEIDAFIQGEYNLQKIPLAVTTLLNKYAPSYFVKPKQQLSNENFYFYVKTKDVSEYVKLLSKGLSGFNNATFEGTLVMPGNKLTLNADIPEFVSDKRVFSKINLSARGTGDSLFTTIEAGQIILTDSFTLPKSKLDLVTVNDVTQVSIQTSASKTISNANLFGSIQTLPNGVIIHFNPSSFYLNDKKWELLQEGDLTIVPNNIEKSKIIFKQGEQEIAISTEPNDANEKTDIFISLTKVNLNDFTPLIKGIPRIEGVATGELKIENPLKSPYAAFEGKVEKFAFENKNIGTLYLTANSYLNNKKVNYTVGTNEDAYSFNTDGSYNWSDSADNNLDLNFNASKFDLSLLQPYLASIFSNIKGNASTNLKVLLGKKGKTVVGDVRVTTGQLMVNYTQCTYKFANETLQFNDNDIDLGRLELKDTLGNTALASGTITHNFFNNFGFTNLRVTTDRLLLLNTTKKDNANFYGKIIGKAQLRLNGPESDIQMNINGEPSSIEKDENHIYIPNTEGKETGGISDYVEIIQYGTKLEDLGKEKKNTNVTLNMALQANKFCAIDVILDEETGDIVKGKGNGNLNIQVGSNKPLTMRGNYIITEGEYTFNFQSLTNKYFLVENGSRIDWDGDPYKAKININANYIAKNVDVSSIASLTGSRQRQNIIIRAKLSEFLLQPKIAFEFDVPKGTNLENDIVARKKLEEFKNDPNEMNKQVVSLLLFGNFLNNSQNFLSGNNVLAATTSTIGGVVSNFISNALNDLLKQATGDLLKFDLDVNANLDLNTQVRQFQAIVKPTLRVFLNDRLQLAFGANYDYNNPFLQLQNRSLITPEFEISWLVNKSGTIRVVGFNRSNFELTNGQRNRTGISLTYKKEAENFWDLFRRRRKK
jgi:hypothetical protein